MDIRDIIQSEKRIKSGGIWAVGTMPRTAFPLSKSGNKAYKLGNRRWRVVTFDAAGFSCRLLINYSYELSQYQAMMGVESNGDTKVLASLERHPTHKGWHVHVCCDPIPAAPAGIKRGYWVKSFNGSGRKHQVPIPNSDNAAFVRAMSFFRLDKTVEGGGLI
jgi:hypothetical protein